MGEKEKEQKVASQEIEKGDSLDDKIFKIVSIVVQWYLVLEQIRSERATESYFSGSSLKCRCSKGRHIIEKCEDLKQNINKIINKNIGVSDDVIERTNKDIVELGSSLRTSISIQIPASLRSEGELSERACSLVMTGDVGDTVTEAMAGVVTSIQDLFNMAGCDHEEDSETVSVPQVPAPLSRVMDIGSPRGKRRKAEDDGNPMKPKRFRAARKSMDEEEGFRPYKPPPPSPDVLNLLEKKKKLVKKNGLLQFVLWREAYRGERERTTEVETKSAKKFMSMARRRKRSPFQSVKNNI